MNEQRIREIVREEMKKAAEDRAAEVVLTMDGEEFAHIMASAVSQSVKDSLSNDDKPLE